MMSARVLVMVEVTMTMVGSSKKVISAKGDDGHYLLSVFFPCNVQWISIYKYILYIHIYVF